MIHWKFSLHLHFTALGKCRLSPTSPCEDLGLHTHLNACSSAGIYESEVTLHGLCSEHSKWEHLHYKTLSFAGLSRCVDAEVQPYVSVPGGTELTSVLTTCCSTDLRPSTTRGQCKHPSQFRYYVTKKTMNWGVLIEHILWRQHASHGTSAVTGPRNTPFDVISRLAIQTQPSCYASLPVPLWVQRETLQRASQFLKIRYLVFISTWWTGLSLRAAAAPWRFSVG